MEAAKVDLGEVWAVIPKQEMDRDDVAAMVEAFKRELPGQKFVVFGSPVELVPLVSLDAMWRAVEAACEQRGLVLEEVTRFNAKGDWQAAAWEPNADLPHTTASGPSPTAALTLLLRRLVG